MGVWRFFWRFQRASETIEWGRIYNLSSWHRSSIITSTCVTGTLTGNYWSLACPVYISYIWGSAPHHFCTQGPGVVLFRWVTFYLFIYSILLLLFIYLFYYSFLCWKFFYVTTIMQILRWDDLVVETITGIQITITCVLSIDFIYPVDKSDFYGLLT